MLKMNWPYSEAANLQHRKASPDLNPQEIEKGRPRNNKRRDLEGDIDPETTECKRTGQTHGQLSVYLVLGMPGEADVKRTGQTQGQLNVRGRDRPRDN
jgi:hypothetical protein